MLIMVTLTPEVQCVQYATMGVKISVLVVCVIRLLTCYPLHLDKVINRNVTKKVNVFTFSAHP